jgi:hypothetical protein
MQLDLKSNFLSAAGVIETGSKPVYKRLQHASCMQEKYDILQEKIDTSDLCDRKQKKEKESSPASIEEDQSSFCWTKGLPNWRIRKKGREGPRRGDVLVKKLLPRNVHFLYPQRLLHTS